MKLEDIPCEGGLIVNRNEHKTVYETIDQYYDHDDWASPEEYEKASEADDVWAIQWYPHTPVGFCIVIASTLEACLKAIDDLD